MAYLGTPLTHNASWFSPSQFPDVIFIINKICKRCAVLTQLIFIFSGVVCSLLCASCCNLYSAPFLSLSLLLSDLAVAGDPVLNRFILDSWQRWTADIARGMFPQIRQLYIYMVCQPVMLKKAKWLWKRSPLPSRPLDAFFSHGYWKTVSRCWVHTIFMQEQLE